MSSMVVVHRFGEWSWWGRVAFWHRVVVVAVVRGVDWRLTGRERWALQPDTHSHTQTQMEA